jgi:hypothetical protein
MVGGIVTATTMADSEAKKKHKKKKGKSSR